MLNSVLTEISLPGLDADPSGWLTIALAFSPQSITAPAIQRFESSMNHASAQDVAILAAAAAASGQCTPRTRAIITHWLAGLADHTAPDSSLMWSIFALSDAPGCVQPSSPALRQAVSQVTDTARFALGHAKSTDPTLSSWLSAETGCLERSGPRMNISSTTTRPANWDDAVGSSPPSILDLYAQIRLSQIRTSGCVPSWITH